MATFSNLRSVAKILLYRRTLYQLLLLSNKYDLLTIVLFIIDN